MNKYYGQFEPQVDRLIYERYFSDSNLKGVFVECGAFDGLIECSCKFFEETLGWSGFNLEPAPSNFLRLLENRPQSRNLKVGLSNSDGKCKFTHVISPIVGVNFGNGSISHTSNHLQDLRERGCSFVDVEIDVLTWRTFIQTQSIDHVDLLVLDVEGHELAVIDGMRGSTVLPHIICVEVGHLDFTDISSAMQNIGYVYDITSHVNAFFIRLDRVGNFQLT